MTIIEEYYTKMKKKEAVRMKGIVSSSFERLVALGFAGTDQDPNNIDVLFVINWGHQYFHHFKMNRGYSPFWDTEKEVVIMDSHLFYITDIKE